MSFVDQILAKLFPKKQTANQGITFSESLRRSDAYLAGYEAWKKNAGYQEIFATLYQQYKTAEATNDNLAVLHVFESDYANGFFFTIEAQEEKLSHYLFDFLRDRVLSIGPYYLYTSSVKTTEKKSVVETAEQHYLKPSQRMVKEKKLVQQYGNIQLQHLLENNQPKYVKLMANIYAGRSYSTPLPFEELMQRLLAD